MATLKDYFRPEFLNRLDDIIIFDILKPEVIQKIVGIQVEMVKKRLADKEIVLDVSEEVLAELSQKGYDPHYGARPLKRLIQTKILNPIASLMISKGVMQGGAISVGLKDKEFTFEVKKGKAGAKISPFHKHKKEAVEV